MRLKDCVECAFGHDGENRILQFLRGQELAECDNDAARWILLLKKCESWRKEFLLWEKRTYINGVHGWHLNLAICKLRLPEKKSENWTEYLYRMTLLLVVSGMDEDERSSIAKAGTLVDNLDILCSDYFINSDCSILTREQWLEEMKRLRRESWDQYRKSPGNNPAYHKAMEKNYPEFDAVLECLGQEIKACEAVKMNDYGGDESVWYFVKTEECFYILCVSDAM